MSDVIPYNPSGGALTRLLASRDQRNFARELAAVQRPARLAQARMTANAFAAAEGMQGIAALSRLEVQLANGDEITAQRLGQIVNAATATVTFQVQMLGLGR